MPDEERNQHTQAIKAMLNFKIDLLTRDAWNSVMNRPKSLGKRWAYWQLWKTALKAARAFVKTGQAGQDQMAILHEYFPAETFSSLAPKKDYRRLAEEFNSRLDKHDGYAKALAELASGSEALTENRRAQHMETASIIRDSVMVQLLVDHGLDKNDPINDAVKIQKEATKLLK